jgi:hypothetical protein
LNHRGVECSERHREKEEKMTVDREEELADGKKLSINNKHSGSGVLVYVCQIVSLLSLLIIEH